MQCKPLHHRAGVLFKTRHYPVRTFSMQAQQPSASKTFSNVTLRIACSPADYASFGALSLEYSKGLGVSLDFQGFQAELAGLPGCYAQPRGCIIIASASHPDDDGVMQDVGAVAVRPLETSKGLNPATAAGAVNSDTSSYTGLSSLPSHCSSASISSSSITCSTATASTATEPGQQQQDQQLPEPGTGGTSFCEMKRLYVAPAAQGLGIGRQLVARALQEARVAGHTHMVLDTLERLTAANKLYEFFEFAKRTPYYGNPLDGVVYWQKEL